MKLFSALRAWCAGHKKLTATIIASLVNLVPDKYLTQDQKLSLAGTIVAYVIGQGVADAGKERAKIEAATYRSMTASAPAPSGGSAKP